MAGLVVGEVDSQVPADLLRTPPVRQLLGDHCSQLRMEVDTTVMMSSPTRGRPPMRIEGTIRSLGSVPTQLSRDRRR